MITLSQIQAPVASSLERFDGFVEQKFKADNPIIAEMMIDAISSRGKGVRPLLVMLCAALFDKSEDSEQRVFIAAMMVEMIHLSSLIHDDVIDESMMRRGRPSLNAKWQSKRAVLAGDYILARNVTIGLESGHTDIVTHVVGTIATLCEGEVMQDDCARRVAMSKEDYIDIIGKKTASLLAASSSVGALAVGAPDEAVRAMQDLGYLLGLAFQIQDDILDYNPSVDTGKAALQDVGEGKITLPLLLALERVSKEEREQVLRSFSAGELGVILDFVKREKGVEQARKVMAEYITRAKSLLGTWGEGSPAQAALYDLCDFIAERKK